MPTVTSAAKDCQGGSFGFSVFGLRFSGFVLYLRKPKTEDQRPKKVKIFREQNFCGGV
jgi:hypothetical protein